MNICNPFMAQQMSSQKHILAHIGLGISSFHLIVAWSTVWFHLNWPPSQYTTHTTYDVTSQERLMKHKIQLPQKSSDWASLSHLMFRTPVIGLITNNISLVRCWSILLKIFSCIFLQLQEGEVLHHFKTHQHILIYWSHTKWSGLTSHMSWYGRELWSFQGLKKTTLKYLIKME
jgi:hypothetical protein